MLKILKGLWSRIVSLFRVLGHPERIGAVATGRYFEILRITAGKRHAWMQSPWGFEVKKPWCGGESSIGKVVNIPKHS